MKRKMLWLVISSLMTLSLVAAACGPAAPTIPTAPTAPTTPTTPTQEKPQQEVVKPAAEAPKYGGTLNILTTSEAGTTYPFGGGYPAYTSEPIWIGDWAKGYAGSYGTNEADYRWTWHDDWSQSAGLTAESVKWTVDSGKNEGTIIYQIRQGIHWALNPASEASRLAAGRELIADDILFATKTSVTDPKADLYLRNPELRAAKVTKTGAWEVTVSLPLQDLVSGISRLSSFRNGIGPPEVMKKYGEMTNWRNSVGTGPFILTDYVAGSSATFVRNPNYWGKDPVGPGKGNQLPYLDGIKLFIIPDRSTQQAALRTGKIDQLDSVAMDDFAQFQKTTPALLSYERSDWPTILGTSASPVKMRVDKAPFNDVRVRRAMLMAIDFKAISQSFAAGRGNYISWPHSLNIAGSYGRLFFVFDDPDLPESARELFSYKPEKAKQLLKEAGYPAGFKTHVLLVAGDVDLTAIYKDYWSKIGVDVELRVRESGALNTIVTGRTHEAMIRAGGTGPPSIFMFAPSIYGESTSNASLVNDSVISEGLAKARLTIITEKDGYSKAIEMTRELYKYVLDQAYAVPDVKAPAYAVWWPWLKNYAGEISVGYGVTGNWAKWVWLDEALKKSMGY